MRVKFTILGEPQGKGRPRFARTGGYVKTYTPEKTASYENLVKLEYRRQCNDFKFDREIPLEVQIVAFYGIPKSTSQKKKRMMLGRFLRPMKKPDMDNVAKVILDSLNEIAFHDDVQVVDCTIRKYYAESPRVTVFIQEARQPEPESEGANGQNP